MGSNSSKERRKESDSEDEIQQVQQQMPIVQQHANANVFQVQNNIQINQYQQNQMPFRHLESGRPTMSSPHSQWARKEDMLPVSQQTGADQTGQDLPDFDLKECISLNAKLGQELLKCSGSSQTLPLLVNVKESKFDELEIEINTPIDLVCVIDISGSMSGSRIEYVKKTLLALLQFLEGKNRIAIVLFDDTAEVLMNFKRVNDDNIGRIQDIVNSIHTRGSTNIVAGVHEAQSLIGRRESKNQVSSIFVLSDGQHNSGPISNDILFNGDIERTRGAEYTLSSFGYGDDHDANTLQSMAEVKGGNYYFVQEIDTIDECFADCLGMVSSCLGQDLVGTVTLCPGELLPNLRFQDVYGPYWIGSDPVKRQFNISNFFAGFNRNILSLLALDAFPEGAVTEETQVKLADVSISVKTVTEPIRIVKIETEVFITLVPGDSEQDVKEDVDVEKQIMRVRGAQIMTEAEKLKDANKYDEAIQMIDLYEQDLEGKQFKEEALFEGMKESINQQKLMINNDKNGVRNKFKSVNYIAQTKNMYMNEQSAPQWGGKMAGVYGTKKQKRMAGRFSKS